MRYSISEPYLVFWNVVPCYWAEVCDPLYQPTIKRTNDHGFRYDGTLDNKCIADIYQNELILQPFYLVVKTRLVLIKCLVVVIPESPIWLISIALCWNNAGRNWPVFHNIMFLSDNSLSLTNGCRSGAIACRQFPVTIQSATLHRSGVSDGHSFNFIRHHRLRHCLIDDKCVNIIVNGCSIDVKMGKIVRSISGVSCYVLNYIQIRLQLQGEPLQSCWVVLAAVHVDCQGCELPYMIAYKSSRV